MKEKVELCEIKNNPNPGVIEMCEDILHMAKNGDIQSICVAGSTSDGETFNCFSGGDFIMALLGEIRAMERDFIDNYVDIRRKPSWEFCE